MIILPIIQIKEEAEVEANLHKQLEVKLAIIRQRKILMENQILWIK
jgi:hypothetical protein